MSLVQKLWLIFFLTLSVSDNLFTMDTNHSSKINIIHATSSDQGSRDSFEDTSFPNSFSPSSLIAKNTHFFGIYDGHGGVDCANHLSTNLHKTVKDTEGFKRGDIQSALLVGYEICNETFRQLVTNEDECSEGSTAATALFYGSELWIANAGDSEIVLCCEDKKAHCLTEQHSACCEQEILRVELLGGKIIYKGPLSRNYLENYCSSYKKKIRRYYRLENPHNQLFSIIPTRSFGDYAYKPFLISTPFVQKIDLSSPGFIILASDGLWDTMSYQAAVDAVLNYLEKNGKTIESVDQEIASDIADSLVELALDISYWEIPKEKITIATADNITVTVVFFNPPIKT